MFCYRHPDEGSFYTTYIWKKNIHMFTDHCIWIDMRENIGIYVYVSEGERQRERVCMCEVRERSESYNEISSFNDMHELPWIWRYRNSKGLLLRQSLIGLRPKITWCLSSNLKVAIKKFWHPCWNMFDLSCLVSGRIILFILFTVKHTWISEYNILNSLFWFSVKLTQICIFTDTCSIIFHEIFLQCMVQ